MFELAFSKSASKKDALQLNSNTSIVLAGTDFFQSPSWLCEIDWDHLFLCIYSDPFYSVRHRQKKRQHFCV